MGALTLVSTVIFMIDTLSRWWRGISCSYLPPCLKDGRASTTPTLRASNFFFGVPATILQRQCCLQAALNCFSSKRSAPQ
jgi:hypothetical protein